MTALDGVAPKLPPKNMRHTFVSIYLEAGGKLVDMAALIGDTAKQVSDNYAFALRREFDEIMTRL